MPLHQHFALSLGRRQSIRAVVDVDQLLRGCNCALKDWFEYWDSYCGKYLWFANRGVYWSNPSAQRGISADHFLRETCEYIFEAEVWRLIQFKWWQDGLEPCEYRFNKFLLQNYWLCWSLNANSYVLHDVRNRRDLMKLSEERRHWFQEAGEMAHQLVNTCVRGQQVRGDFILERLLLTAWL